MGEKKSLFIMEAMRLYRNPEFWSMVTALKTLHFEGSEVL